MTFSERLKTVRESHKINQEEWAEIAKVSRHAQIRYEKGETMPTVDYFENLMTKGIDVCFLVTGKREKESFDAAATEIALTYSQADPNHKAVFEALAKITQPTKHPEEKPTRTTTIGSVGSYSEGDMHGDVNIANKK